MVDLQICEATPRDRPEIIGLVSKVMQEFELSVSVELIEADIETALSHSLNERARFWIARHQNAIAGSIAILPKSEDECQLKRFYVMPEYRGLGLGKQLYGLAEQFARKAGYKAITLEASRRFTKAITFYLQNGYELIREVDNVWEDNIYRKPL